MLGAESINIQATESGKVLGLWKNLLLNISTVLEWT
jgi:hypothetical protein